MARLFTSGFELNNLATEFTTVTGATFTCQSTTVLQGGYAGKELNPNGYAGVSYKFNASVQSGNYFARVYLRVHTYPLLILLFWD